MCAPSWRSPPAEYRSWRNLPKRDELSLRTRLRVPERLEHRRRLEDALGELVGGGAAAGDHRVDDGEVAHADLRRLRLPRARLARDEDRARAPRGARRDRLRQPALRRGATEKTCGSSEERVLAQVVLLGLLVGVQVEPAERVDRDADLPAQRVRQAVLEAHREVGDHRLRRQRREVDHVVHADRMVVGERHRGRAAAESARALLRCGCL